MVIVGAVVMVARRKGGGNGEGLQTVMDMIPVPCSLILIF